jgi:hypothetical protein
VILAIATTGALLWPAVALGGPPYTTDDPEPVEYGRGEIYGATQDSATGDGASGTAPHLEVNSGVLPGLQIHVIASLVYNRLGAEPSHYGVGDIELGAKLRLIEQGVWRPMVGTFMWAAVCARTATRPRGRADRCSLLETLSSPLV